MGAISTDTDMIEQAVTVSDSEILILGQFFVHKDYSITGKDLLLDILSQQYCGQQILVRLWDGENINFSGFELFIKFVCDQLQIPYSHVTIESHCSSLSTNFNLSQLELGIFISVNQYLPREFNRDRSSSKFVGSLLGRYNSTRLRLAYEIDQAFPGDNFTTFQPSANFLQGTLKYFSQQYAKELAWIKIKQFDQDLISQHYMGMIDWQTACAHYGNVWNRYQIEIVSETDAIDNFWFTEKTANCLATGKPFVLVSGQYSLHKLKDMGFQTFNHLIDESYDAEPTPYKRIIRLTQALTEVYNSSSKEDIIENLYTTAEKNINLYKQYADR
jgi:hypothetical protein